MADYGDEVNDAYRKRYGGESVSKTQKMNFRFDVARALLHDRFSHLMGELDRKADAQHQVDINQWNLVLDDISAAADVSQ